MDASNRIELLENTVLAILLNPSLYEYLQEILEGSIKRAPFRERERIYNFVVDETKELLTGPDEITKEQVDQIKKTVAFKMDAYKRTGNHDD